MKPTTDAGRRAAEATRGLADYYNTQPLRHARLIDAIDPVAIEQEAVTRVLDALTGEVAGLYEREWRECNGACHDVSTEAVLALIEQHRPKGGPG